MSNARLPRGQRERPFNDAGIMPAQLERTCRFAADEFLDRDAERLAEAAGLSHRVVNHQRERSEDRRSAVETLCRMLYGARSLGWNFDRRLSLLRPALDALGADAEPRAEELGRAGVMSALSDAIRETGAALSDVAAARADGRIEPSEAEHVAQELQHSIDQLHRLRCEVMEAAKVELRPLRRAN